MGASVQDHAVLSDIEIERAVVEIVGSLAPDKGVGVTAETALIDGLGYDSAQMIELGFALERRLGCRLKQKQLGATTVADLVGIVRDVLHPETDASPTPFAVQDVFSAEQAALDAEGVPPGVAKPGDELRDFNLLDPHGDSMTLFSALGGRTAVVVLYRGAWCPYCNSALRAYQNELVPTLHDRGITLLAISPQKPDGSLSAKEKNDLSITVLSDPGNHVANALGVQTAPTDDVQAAQRVMGIDLRDTNADGTPHLPMPTVVIVDSSRVIRWIDVRPNYTTRTAAHEILSAVESLPL